MSEDNRRDAYLWDPSASPSTDVEALEKSLATARFEITRKPLPLPAARPARGWIGRPGLAMAASLLLVVVGASSFWSWRSSWPANSPWTVAISRPAGGDGVERTRLRLDEPMRLDAVAQVSIARIGSMQVQPGSSLTLVESSSRRHRVLLEQGSVSVRVWAPPGKFAFNTPAGTVLDMGCIFDLTVDADGTSRVAVKTGWVELENGWGEVLVPAGASSVMTAAGRPATPIFDDADAKFVQSVRAYEQASDEKVRSTLVAAIKKSARQRDVYTLLLLARHSSDGLRRPLLERAAELVPPPTAGTVEAIMSGDLDKLWAWKDTLGLPPAKSWWRNWKDALPL
jgi:hypothetical protein